jgi:hypothetical protein
MLRNYSQETLDLFASAVKGNRKAFQALMTTEKRPELAAFSNAIRGDKNAVMWLRARATELWVIYEALDSNQLAIKKLQQKDDKFDISFVLACRNRMEGKYWLSENNYRHFLPVCEAIAATLKTVSKIGAWDWLYNGSVRKLH